MSSLEIELSTKRNKFGKSLVFSILGLLLFYNILSIILVNYFPYYKMEPSQKILTLFFLAIAYVAVLISRTKYNFFTLYKIMNCSFFLLVFYLSLNVCYKTAIVNLFYIPILLMTLILTDVKTTTICTFSIIILCIATSDIALFFNIAHPIKLTPDNLEILKYLEYVVIIFAAYLSLLILYYYIEFVKIQLKYSNTVEDTTLESLSEKEFINVEDGEIEIIRSNDSSENEKFEQLFIKIINYFNTEKPFKDSNFNKRTLASLLQTNETYISKALNQEGNKNFNSFVNEYRINQVIEEFNNKNYRKYTIEHIYNKAGFTQQSTFNRVFKELTGTTPSDYIDNIENKPN